jgi:hypothetical protein
MPTTKTKVSEVRKKADDDVDMADDDADYQPPDDTDNVSVIRVKHRRPSDVGPKDKGKEKMKEVVRKDEDIKQKDKGKGKMKDVVTKDEKVGTQPKRKPPQPTEEVRKPPCQRCVKKKLTCYLQAGVGKACLHCAQMKLRCQEAKEKETTTTTVKIKRVANKKVSRPMSSPGSPISFLSDLSASSHGPSAPSRKTRLLSKKLEGKRVDRMEEDGGIIRGMYKSKSKFEFLLLVNN